MPSKKPKTTPKQAKFVEGVALYFGLPRDAYPVLRSEVNEGCVLSPAMFKLINRRRDPMDTPRQIGFTARHAS